MKPPPLDAPRSGFRAPYVRPIVHDGLLELRVDSLVAQFAAAVAIIGAVTVVGIGLHVFVPGTNSAALWFPAVLFASLIGGWRSGVAAGALALLARVWLTNPRGVLGLNAITPANYILFLLAGAAVIAIGAYARGLLARLRANGEALAEQSLHYRALFETMSEGYAVCETIRDRDGRLTDYTIAEINPALRRLLGVGPEVMGSRLSQFRGNWTPWLEACDRAMTTGEAVSFERFNPRANRWHEVHINRLTPTRMGQLFFDVTERKADEARQSELFDELNHRVKNNLAMVASLLQLQARGAGEAVRTQLAKAAARVLGIAEVHNALSRGASREAVDFGAYLQDLCASLRRTLGLDERIHLGVETEATILDVDTAIPLGMIVSELVTNAAKYAYPEGRSGHIEVAFRRAGADWVLSVRDEGEGLPDESARGEGGLGMRLVRSLSQQVGGELVLLPGPGAGFEVRFPART